MWSEETPADTLDPAGLHTVPTQKSLILSKQIKPNTEHLIQIKTPHPDLEMSWSSGIIKHSQCMHYLWRDLTLSDAELMLNLHIPFYIRLRQTFLCHSSLY